MRVLTGVALAFWATMASASDRQPTILEPTSQWIVDYADNNCRLIRNFGTGKDAIKLVFEQLAPHAPMTVMLIGHVRPANYNNILSFEPLPDVRLRSGQGFETVDTRDKVILWPRSFGLGRWGLIPDATSAAMRRADPVAAEASPSAPWDPTGPKRKWADHRWEVEPPEQWQADQAGFGARADAVTALVLNPGRSGSIALHIDGLNKPLQALEQCASDSLPDWGIDPAVHASISTRAHPASDPAKFFTSDDYPKAALQSFKEDILQVWLIIDAQGGLANCRVISDFASPEINDAICGMIRRKQRFVPARTSNGKPVPDFYIESFVFRLAWS